MSKKFRKQSIALLMVASLSVTLIPVKAIEHPNNETAGDIMRQESIEVTTGGMIQVDLDKITETLPVEETQGNLVNNFSFEEVTNIKEGEWEGDLYAANWKASPWGSKYLMPYISLDTSQKVSGNHSVRFESINGSARGWIEQRIEVKPSTTYILEGYMKSQDVNGARFGVQVLEYVGASTTAITTGIGETLKLRIGEDTSDWQKYRAEFKTSDQTTRISLRGYLGTHDIVNRGGTAWIDDIVLTEKTAVAVEGITLPEKARIAVGDTITLQPVFAPVDATNRKLVWQSQDDSIATVSASGMVKGVREGMVTIKAISEDGGYEAECLVTVEANSVVNLIDNGSFEEIIKVINADEKKYWKDELAPAKWNGLWIPTAGDGLMLELDSTTFSHGTQSVHIYAPKQSRVSFNRTVPINAAKSYRLSMNIKTEDVVGTGAYFRVQYLDENNKKTQDAVPGISGVKGSKDWDNYELVLKDIPSNTVKMKIEVFFENATGHGWIDDARLVETYDFYLNQKVAKLLAGETLQLEPVFGADVANKKVEWISSDENVAVVDENGYVTARVPGVATITATTIDGNKATCSISVEDPELIPIYEGLRQKWADRITINNILDKNNPDYIANMESLEAEAKVIWETMNKYDASLGEIDRREELWDKFNTKAESKDLTSTISNIRTLARAYASEGCGLYKNEALAQDILGALDWFYAKRYNEDVKMYKNWWDWDIGIPQKLNDALVLMYDSVSKEQLEDHLRALNRFVPTPVSVPGGPNPLTGANLLDTAMVSAVSGMLEGSNRRMVEAKEAVSDVLPYVTKGDGFYEDGSFIQHTDIPYAGGYGGVLMGGISNLLFITDESPWEVTDPLIENVYDWIINAFEPLYYKGAIMDMVNGRGMSRYASSDHNKGKGLLPKMLALAETAPEPKKTQIKAFIKENVLADTLCEAGYFDKMNINDVLAFKELLDDVSIPARGDLILHKVYGAMDRVVHHRPGFSLGISMHSSRISAYEVGNGENKKAWHTADGMLYLYNNDLQQYGDDFWPTVDPMRLSGTTTDHSERTNKDWSTNTSSKSWVGGASLNGLYGVTGMEFEMEPGKSTLTGKKSWFMFDDEIVALGTGINSTDNKNVETIVENRKIKDSGDNTLIVDGVNVLDEFGEVDINKANWAFLGGNTQEGKDTIGYYFPSGTDLKVMRETRRGSWNAINNDGPTTPTHKNYISLATSHGNNPVDAKYSYVLLPNKTAEEVATYSDQADIEIIANNSAVQVVREKQLGVMGMNFWSPGAAEYVTAKNSVSIMIEEGVGTLSLGISDPTHLSKQVQVVLDKSDYRVVSKDDTVVVKEVGDQIEITVTTDKSMGKTHKLELVANQPVDISLDQPDIRLIKKQSEIVRASVLPDSLNRQALVWKSNNDRVASVVDNRDGTATIKALKKGEALITVTIPNTGLSATCKVSVRNNDNGQGGKSIEVEDVVSN